MIPRRPHLVQALAGAMGLAVWAGAAFTPPSLAAETLQNAALHLSPREVLFFSAPAGRWTAIRLDAGERILRPAAPPGC